MLVGRYYHLIDTFEAEAEDGTGRRVDILRYRELTARVLELSEVSPEDGPDEWFERSGERLVSVDGRIFRSPHRRYVRVMSS